MDQQTVPDHIAVISRPCPALMKYYILKALATLIVAPLTLMLLYFRFHTMRYRFDAEGIHMAWGILMRHEIMLNYSRIQDIQLRSNVVERWLGLARIEIQTASGSSGSEMTLEGITDHTAMRDFLYSRMRGARNPHTVSAMAPEGDSLAEILTEVAGELRAIRKALERRNA
jgi:putative membrane protein